LHFSENWKVFFQGRTLGTKEELIKVAKFAEHLPVEPPNVAQEILSKVVYRGRGASLLK
jgi:hypothetical protein